VPLKGVDFVIIKTENRNWSWAFFDFAPKPTNKGPEPKQ